MYIVVDLTFSPHVISYIYFYTYFHYIIVGLWRILKIWANRESFLWLNFSIINNGKIKIPTWDCYSNHDTHLNDVDQEHRYLEGDYMDSNSSLT